MLDFKTWFDHKSESPTKLKMDIVKDEPILYHCKTVIAYRKFMQNQLKGENSQNLTP